MGFTEHFRIAIADVFPFEDEENFESWRERLLQQHYGRRALAAGVMVSVSRDIHVAKSQRKRLWIAAARLAFRPDERQRCFVCSKFQAIAEAHHVVPLARQFELGYEEPSHQHEWLCPNHHAIVHLHVDRLDSSTWPSESAFDDITVAENRRIGELIQRAVGK